MTIWYGWRTGEDPTELLARLTKEDEELLASRRHGEALTQSRMAQALMKEAAAALGQEDCVIRRSEAGAPVTEVLFVSCSHTRDFICGAASHRPMGIDAQPLEAVRWGAARRCFTQQEQDFLAQLSGEAADQWFTRLWTLKEAYGKMTGLGLMGAKGITFTQNGDQVLCSDPAVEISLYRDGDVLISLVVQKKG